MRSSVVRVFVLAAAVAVGPALAGALLSAQDLVKEAAGGGVAVVDNALDGDVAFVEWLAPPRSTAPLGDLRGVCVPDRGIVSGWLERNSSHPGRPVWEVLAREGKTRQLVFLAPQTKDGATTLRPVCEAEVLDGLTFQQHPGFDGYRAQVQQLLSPSTSSPSTSSSTSPPPPAEQPASTGCGWFR